MSKARSFFEKLTGSAPAEEEYAESIPVENEAEAPQEQEQSAETEQAMEEEAQLTIDLYQTADDIVIQTMVAGVRPENLDVSISHDMVTLNGKRMQSQHVSDDNYYHRELFWGSFSRSILLPQEVDAEEAEATMKNGLLTIKLPKLDKTKVQKVRVKPE